MSLTKEQFAEMLNGREYPFELTPSERATAKASRLLVIYGQSDDLMEFDGVWREEAGVYGGGEVAFTLAGKVPNMNEVEDALDVLKSQLGIRPEIPGLLKVTAKWCEEMPDGRKPSWHYATDLPHAQFDIREDGGLYCVGIVLDLKELEGGAQ